MVMVRRQLVMEVEINGVVVNDVLSFGISHSLEQPFPRATITCATRHGDYNNSVAIRIGTLPGNGMASRFVGKMRDVHASYFPRGVTHDVIGRLGQVAEYYNGEDPKFIGGLMVQDLTSTGRVNGVATAKEIIEAVLTKVGVPFNPVSIGGTGRLYGTSFKQFVWGAGTPFWKQLGMVPRQRGESALDYIHRYNEIEAEYNGGNDGGFYRIVEKLDGEIVVVRVGGRPHAIPDTDAVTGADMIFTEGGSPGIDPGTGLPIPEPAPGTVNILSASFNRHYPTGNRVLVRGMDVGIGSFAWFFEAPGGSCTSAPDPNAPGGTNPFMASTDHFYDPNPPASSMIEWDTIAQSTAQGVGMDCETVAMARLLEVNRETVTGELTTAEDWMIAPTQTHLVQGPGGAPDRLLTGEPVWCQANDITFEVGPNGAPVFTQHPTYIGGGLQTP